MYHLLAKTQIDIVTPTLAMNSIRSPRMFRNTFMVYPFLSNDHQKSAPITKMNALSKLFIVMSTLLCCSLSHAQCTITIEADGSFESLVGVAGNEFNSNVTGGRWRNGDGSADSYMAPVPIGGSGHADGMPPSSDAGVFAAGLALPLINESFYTEVTNLTVGAEYEVRFEQANAGVDSGTELNELSRWKVKFGDEVQFSNPMPYLGAGNQVWDFQVLTFTATATTQRLEFFSDLAGGTSADGIEYMAIDGIFITSEQAIDVTTSAGQDGEITICADNLSPINLFDLILDEDAGGTWSHVSGTGGTFDAATATYTPSAGATTNTFMYSHQCPIGEGTVDSSTAVVNMIADLPDAGSDATLSICRNATATDLFSLLGGTPQIGGAWSGPSVLSDGHLGTFDPSTGSSGTYAYTVTESGICTASSAVTVTIIDPPVLSIDTTTCEPLTQTTYDIAFNVSPTGAAVSVDFGTLVGNEIVGIPEGVDVTITAENNGCSETIAVTAPTCGCPSIASPVSPNNPNICQGTNVPELAVALPNESIVGDTVKWYTAPTGGTSVADGLTFRPQDTEPGTFAYYAETVRTVSGCKSQRTPVTLTIVAIPVPDNIEDITVCGTFTLPQLSEGSYFDAVGGTNGGGNRYEAGDAITTTTTLFIYAETETPISCAKENSFTVTVNTLDQLGVPQTLYGCDDETGTAVFDLTQNETLILSGDNTKLIQGYYTQYEDALNASSPIADPTTYPTTASSETIFVRIENQEQTCFSVTEFDVVKGQLQVTLTGDTFLCLGADGRPTRGLNPSIGTGMNAVGYDFDWTLNGEDLPQATPDIPIEAPGTYSVTVTDTTSGCSVTESIEIMASALPTSYDARFKTEAFSDDHTIEATASGSGDYIFSLDGGTFQDSGRFSNVTPGSHQITIKDIYGCGEVYVDLCTLDYPKFFTPNSDGFNDYWNLENTYCGKITAIFIFDRFGRFLTQIDPKGLGWDGFFNGKELPSTDYWFRVDYIENDEAKQFKGHFAMKR